MKKMLLASNEKFLFQKGYSLLGIPFEEMQIGYVTTASKGVDDINYLSIHKNEMKKRGLDFEEMDIEGKSREELRHFLSSKNVVHVEGGNTFYLLKAIRETGFDKMLEECVENGLTYVGTSAGAYIACPTSK
jgi:dipeptidase E